MNTTLIGRIVLIIIILIFSFQLVSTPTPWIFLDALNLLFHEAGHLLFLPFGEFMHILGGSLTQIIIPITFFIYFYIKKEYFATSVMLFWVSDNVINVSVYMRDAIPMQLPLLGGDGVIHDWNWIFTTTNLLPQSYIIGMIFFYLGVILLILSIMGMVYFTYKDLKTK